MNIFWLGGGEFWDILSHPCELNAAISVLLISESIRNRVLVPFDLGQDSSTATRLLPAFGCRNREITASISTDFAER